jgi:hypothetical protein
MTDNVVPLPRVNIKTIDSAEILELTQLADLALHICLNEMDSPISPSGSPLCLILRELVSRARAINQAVWAG